MPPRALAVLRGAATNASTFLDEAHSGDVPAAPLWTTPPPQTMRVHMGGQQPGQLVAAPSNVLSGEIRITSPAVPLAGCGGGIPS